ncbi:hypothetical protein GCM10022381_38160 [Leifsonia kafniensis]|uniref:Uncharacterized protein n=1 Tax=Leifsonia kafniensis TaxID=475957 RepID=A0ABP7L226_9MICO
MTKSTDNRAYPRSLQPSEQAFQPRADSRRSARQPGHTAREARLEQNGLGGRHLGIGLVFSGGFITLFLFWRFAVQWSSYPNPFPTLTAWILLAIVMTVAVISARLFVPQLPRWAFWSVLGCGAVVVALDLAGTTGLRGDGVFPTAAAAVGVLLSTLITVQSERSLLIATGVLGVTLVTAAFLEPRTDPLSLAPDILILSLALLTPAIGIEIVRAFRRMVQLELDLVLVQSTVSQPRFAVGMLASERLAALDFAAETLLDDVAEGRSPLPLPAATAGTAASLATQLRLHLIEGRTETWLYHAVTESEFLGPSVSVEDPNGLAGLLAPTQRDALLLAIWLLISDDTRPATTISLAFGPISPSKRGLLHQNVRFPIKLLAKGVPRQKVDPETWHAIRVVGTHLDSVRDGSLRVDIECSVDNPADA